jgi:hypothetical protein
VELVDADLDLALSSRAGNRGMGTDRPLSVSFAMVATVSKSSDQLPYRRISASILRFDMDRPTDPVAVSESSLKVILREPPLGAPHL